VVVVVSIDVVDVADAVISGDGSPLVSDVVPHALTRTPTTIQITLLRTVFPLDYVSPAPSSLSE
jgi:hypothetical protein